MPEPTCTAPAPEGLDDQEFEDIELELCASTREASTGFDHFADLDAFRAAIRASHWRVDHRRLW